MADLFYFLPLPGQLAITGNQEPWWIYSKSFRNLPTALYEGGTFEVALKRSEKKRQKRKFGAESYNPLNLNSKHGRTNPLVLRPGAL